MNRKSLPKVTVLSAVVGLALGDPDDQALLKPVSAQPGDLQPGEQVTLYEDGDKVKDQVTLGCCGFESQTEQYRVSRRQVAVGQPESISGSSVEAVRYRPPRTTDALDEYAQAVEQCPLAMLAGRTTGPIRPHAGVVQWQNISFPS